MLKYNLLLVSLFSSFLYSQIGNLSNHEGPFHISGTQNDIIVTEEGKVGIGKIDPVTKLEINSGVVGKSGLRLKQITAASTPYYKEAGLLGVDSQGNVVVFGRTNTLPPPCIPVYLYAFGNASVVNSAVTSGSIIKLPNHTNDPNSGNSYDPLTGYFTLKKGVTYQLEASIFNSYEGNTESYFSYEWYTVVNSIRLPHQTNPRATVLQNNNDGFNVIQPYSISFYTPASDMQVALRFTGVVGATNQSYSQKYSYISIRQLNPCEDDRGGSL